MEHKKNRDWSPIGWEREISLLRDHREKDFLPMAINCAFINQIIDQCKQDALKTRVAIFNHFNGDSKAISTTIRRHLS